MAEKTEMTVKIPENLPETANETDTIVGKSADKTADISAAATSAPAANVSGTAMPVEAEEGSAGSGTAGIPGVAQGVHGIPDVTAEESGVSGHTAKTESAAEAGKRCPCCMGDAEEDGDSPASGDEIKTTARSAEEYKKLIHRLNRIEGQIRGIRGMVEKSAYCPDILVQSAAVTAAMNAFNRELLENHIRHCVVRDVREGRTDTVEELVRTMEKLMK